MFMIPLLYRQECIAIDGEPSRMLGAQVLDEDGGRAVALAVVGVLQRLERQLKAHPRVRVGQKKSMHVFRSI